MGFWHRGENRYRLFSDQERKEYGERRRKEHSNEWHQIWISKSGLKSELWTEKAIRDFLPPPIDAGPIKAWKKSTVESVVASYEFKVWMDNRIRFLLKKSSSKIQIDCPLEDQNLKTDWDSPLRCSCCNEALHPVEAYQLMNSKNTLSISSIQCNCCH